ncbi:Uncharacterised protein [BD1-7 clade bacterium]|uniref:Uncharacterized protein n=1 Tax=BD1-7 clade bacterium TaxID=2029982 RepID=A0A5S9PG16_9GAMM|nr:Uncharacterised protein [BD1-7 clade bacterium]
MHSHATTIPNQQHEVNGMPHNTLKLKTLSCAIALATTIVGCSDDNSSSRSRSFDDQLAVTANGTELVVVSIDDAGLITERARAALPGIESYNVNHTIFSIVKKPNANEVYVSSMNECSGNLDADNVGCWGNARVDRFTYSTSGIEHAGVAYLGQQPIRLTTAVLDETTETVTTTLLNQSNDPVSVTSITTLPGSGIGIRIPNTLIPLEPEAPIVLLPFEPAEPLLPETEEAEDTDTVVTQCTDTPLAAGASCTFTFTAAENSDSYRVSIDAADTQFVADISTNSETNVAMITTQPEIVSNEEPEEDSNRTHPLCVADGGDNGNQQGFCAFTALAFSDDGSRLFVNEDDYDTALLFDVNDDGTLTFVAESENSSTSLQGLAVSADGTVLYNGTNTLDVTADDLLSATEDNGGNATNVTVLADETPVLVTTVSTNSVGIYNLQSDPRIPAEIALLQLENNNARYVDIAANNKWLTAAGFDNDSYLSLLSFDGTTLAETTQIGIINDVAPTEPCEETCEYRVRSRTVQISDDFEIVTNNDEESTAENTEETSTEATEESATDTTIENPNTGVIVVASFIQPRSEKAFEKAPYRGRLDSFIVDADGTLKNTDSLELSNESRALLFVTP